MRDAAHDQVRDPRGPAHRDDVDDGDGDQCPQGHRGDELRGGEQVSSPGVLWRVFYLAPAVAGWGWLIVDSGLLADIHGPGVGLGDGVGVVLWWWGVGLLVLDRSVHAYGGVRPGVARPVAPTRW